MEVILLFPPQNVLTSTVLSSGYSGADGAVWDTVIAYGIITKPSAVYLNGTELAADKISFNNSVS